MKLKNFAKVTVIVTISILIYHFGIAKEINETTDQKLSSLKLFTSVIDIIQKSYVEPVALDSLIQGALKGMVSNLDPHSAFMTKDSFKELQVQTSGEFGGLGMEIALKNDVLTVVSPIDDTPAYRAGIKASDRIIKIDGRSTSGLTIDQCLKLLRGIPGTDVKLTIYRGGEKGLLTFKLTRAIIKIKAVKSSNDLGNGVAYFRVSQFTTNTTTELNAAIKKAQTAYAETGGIKSIILDLRNNPGGLLNEAVKVSNLFLAKGDIVSIKGRDPKEDMVFKADNSSPLATQPLIVILNSGSASASEIVAGAIQDNGRGLVLGERSFGKGSVQTIIPIENGGGLRLTTALYYTPSGTSIQAKGIEPDIHESEAVLNKKKHQKTNGDEDEDSFGIYEKDLSGFIVVNTPNKKHRMVEGPSLRALLGYEGILTGKHDDPIINEAAYLLSHNDEMKKNIAYLGTEEGAKAAIELLKATKTKSETTIPVPEEPSTTHTK